MAKRARSTGERKSYTFVEKKRIVAQVLGDPANGKPRQSLTAVATNNNLDKSVLSRWVEDAPNVIAMASAGRGREKKKRPLTKNAEIAKTAYMHYKIYREMLTAITPQNLIRWLTRKYPEDFGSKSEAYKHKFIRTWRRHNCLSIRRKSSLTQLVPAKLKLYEGQFFTMLRSSYEKKRPKHIVFLDETAVLWNPVGNITIEQRGSQSVPIRAENEKKSSTALLWGTADIQYRDDFPSQIRSQHQKPWIIFSGSPNNRRANSIVLEAERLSRAYDVTCRVSETSWINSTIFTDFVKSLPHRAEEDGAWLVMDLHTTHRLPTVVEILKQKNYSVWYVPGGCTCKLQVHDVCINKPFNDSVKKAYHDTQEDCHRVTREDVVNFVIRGLEGVKEDTITRGLRKCIIPQAVTGADIVEISDDSESDETAVEVVSEGETNEEEIVLDEISPADTEYTDDDTENFLREFNELLVVSEPLTVEEDNTFDTV